jgi:CHAD domain-containing protein
VRIGSKKLRYGLEIAADSRAVPAAAKHVRTLKRVQEMLGEMHDLQILQTHVAAVQADSGLPGTGTSQALNAMARHIEDRCRHLHGRYIAATPALRALVDDVAAGIVKELAHGRRRQPLKMGLRASRPRTAGVR